MNVPLATVLAEIDRRLEQLKKHRTQTLHNALFTEGEIAGLRSLRGWVAAVAAVEPQKENEHGG